MNGGASCGIRSDTSSAPFPRPYGRPRGARPLPVEFSASDLWNQILETARPAVPEQSFHTWLSSSKGVALGDGTLVAEVASPFHLEIIEDRYRPVLEEVAHRLTGHKLTISLQAAAPERASFNPVELVQEIRSTTTSWRRRPARRWRTSPPACTTPSSCTGASGWGRPT